MYNLYRHLVCYHHQNHSAFPKHNWLGHDQFWHDTQFSSQNLLLLFFESHWVVHCWLDPFELLVDVWALTLAWEDKDRACWVTLLMYLNR